MKCRDIGLSQPCFIFAPLTKHIEMIHTEMIQQINGKATVMEFTSFSKKNKVSDDELIQAVLQFERSFLSHQKGVVFHCLVRNLNNEYANVLFAENMETLKEIEKSAPQNPYATHFFGQINPGSIQMNFQTIEKGNFEVPEHFACVEYGTFSLKNKSDFKSLLSVSDNIEQQYLFKSENTKAHFIGRISENHFSEVTFGSTLGKTKEVCFGYMENEHCQPMLEMADETTMKLDFWYLIA